MPALMDLSFVFLNGQSDDIADVDSSESADELFFFFNASAD